MKPLTLHVYPKHPDADAYRVGGAYQPYCLVATEKRFSEAELAAEFYKAATDFQSADSMDQLFEDDDSKARLDRARDWMFWTERFAALPNYDEADQ